MCLNSVLLEMIVDWSGLLLCVCDYTVLAILGGNLIINIHSIVDIVDYKYP